MIHRNLVFSAVALLLLPTCAFASGFGIYDANAKATGMGGAFIARADDASAVYYNPAGIAFLDGTNALVNLLPVQPHVTVSFGGEVDSEQRWVVVPAMFLTKKIDDRLAAGIGVFAPIGLGVQYPENYPGNFISYRSMGLAAFIRPTLAYKVTDNLAVAASLDIVYSQMKIDRKLPFSMMGMPIPGAVDNRVTVDGTGFGYSVSALYQAGEDFRIGAKYRACVEIDYEGDADFTTPTFGNPYMDGMMDQMFFDQAVTSGIDVPAEFTIGLYYKASDRLSFVADAAFTQWSSVDVIPMAHENSMLDQDWAMNWEDTWGFKFGAEYFLNEQIALRGGYTRDYSPIPAETLTPFAPDGDRHEFTVGIGYDGAENLWGQMFLDMAFRYIMIEDVTSKFSYFPATFNTDMTFFSISTGFKF